MEGTGYYKHNFVYGLNGYILQKNTKAINYFIESVDICTQSEIIWNIKRFSNFYLRFNFP